MKPIRLIFLLGVLLSLCTGLQAQSNAATVNKAGAIVLDNTQDLKDTYSIDASLFNFESQEDALNYFGSKSTELVAFRPLIHNNVIMMYLQVKKQPTWTLSDWNQYLEDNKVLNTETQHSTSK